MKKKIILVLLLSSSLVAKERWHIPYVTLEAFQQLYDSLQAHPRDLEVTIGSPENTLDNGFDHGWWRHITRHLTLRNGYEAAKVVTGGTFLAFFGAAVLIQKTYASARKIHNFFTSRSVNDQSEDIYRKCKKYEPLFIAYKYIDKKLTRYGIRNYFFYDQLYDEEVDDVLSYITLYEQRAAKKVNIDE